MASWKKTNETWFGDTFDRDATLCSYTIDGVDLSSNGSITTCNTDLLMNGITYASGSNSNAESAYTVAKGINGINSVKLCVDDLEIKFESVADKLKQLQAQIDALKKRPVVTSELRSALKTLHYKREVE
jgi:hypothetical protein